jgi:prepilin-type processing-associated H-X9-DG protein
MGPTVGGSIVILDYKVPVVSVAGPNLNSGEWYQQMQPTPTRPGLARHAGRFNALFGDGSVRTSLMPTIYDPTNNPTVQKQYWGGP